MRLVDEESKSEKGLPVEGFPSVPDVILTVGYYLDPWEVGSWKSVKAQL